MSYFQVKNLSLELKDFSLKDISFFLNEGDFLSIIGPSGAGKSLLLKSIIGLHKLNSGNIILNNEEIRHKKIENRKITVIFQDNNLLPNFNVKKNLLYAMKKKKNIDFKKICEITKIYHLLDRKIHKLSGGEKQRVAITRALLVKPKILLMDEPFSALDSLSKKCIRNLLRDLSKEFNTTIIEVTHNLEDALILANKIGFIQNGELIQFGDLDEIFKRPKNKFIASFINSTTYKGKIIGIEDNMTKIKLSNTILYSNDKISDKKNIEINIRPENICISKIKKIESNAANSIKCKIEKVYNDGIYNTLILKNGDDKFVVKSKKALLESMNISLKDNVYCFIRAKDVNIK